MNLGQVQLIWKKADDWMAGVKENDSRRKGA